MSNKILIHLVRWEDCKGWDARDPITPLWGLCGVQVQGEYSQTDSTAEMLLAASWADPRTWSTVLQSHPCWYVQCEDCKAHPDYPLIALAEL